MPRRATEDLFADMRELQAEITREEAEAAAMDEVGPNLAEHSSQSGLALRSGDFLSKYTLGVLSTIDL